MKRRKREFIPAAFIILLGMLLVLYPWISNYVYEHGVQSTVNVYEKELKDTDSEELQKLRREAESYNLELAKSQITLTDPFFQDENRARGVQYDALLQMDDSGIMCFVDIPKINVYLPVYHGTSNEVLEKGIGHIEGTSLPVGGKGSHSVLSGHTGVNNAKLFTDLTELEQDDLFFIHVLGESMAYRVTSIRVIDPGDTESLIIEKECDLVSLLTCTPYGVNTHRLVVTGERTVYTEEVLAQAESEATDHSSQWLRAYRRAILLGFGSAAVFLLFLYIVRALFARGALSARVRG